VGGVDLRWRRCGEEARWRGRGREAGGAALLRIVGPRWMNAAPPLPARPTENDSESYLGGGRRRQRVDAGTAAAGQRGRRASLTSRSWPAPAVSCGLGTAAAGQQGRRASSTSRSWPAPAVCFRMTTTVRQMQHLDDGGGGSTG
jgi:hypothetical protein